MAMQQRGIWAAAFLGAMASACFGQVGADGIEWCTIGAAGNRAYDGPDPFNLVAGRGSVGYEYKMGKFEVTTGQWLEFFNAALARPDPLPFASARWWGTPIIWGAVRDTSYAGPGTKYKLNSSLANAAMLPVGGVSWRQAAVLCNWLSNGKGTSSVGFMNGAYDVTSFTPDNAFPTFTDQAAHTPGAKYWIPTLDEWMKAVHYDANANGGTGKWWQQPNGTDVPLVYGPPPSFGGDGTGQANTEFWLPGDAQYRIPLGAYPTTVSPWGLLDAAGGTAEWIEDIEVVDDRMYRLIEGSSWTGVYPPGQDSVWGYGGDTASIRLTGTGFRLASNIPCPTWATVFLCMGGVFSRRAPRKE